MTESILFVCGSRGYSNYTEFAQVTSYLMYEQFNFDQIISGGNRSKKVIRELRSGTKQIEWTGADYYAELWSNSNGLGTPVVFDPNWKESGKSAGPIRNSDIIDTIYKFQNKAILAFWDGNSIGTTDVIKKAKGFDIPLYLYQYTKNDDNPEKFMYISGDIRERLEF